MKRTHLSHATANRAFRSGYSTVKRLNFALGFRGGIKL